MSTQVRIVNQKSQEEMSQRVSAVIIVSTLVFTALYYLVNPTYFHAGLFFQSKQNLLVVVNPLQNNSVNIPTKSPTFSNAVWHLPRIPRHIHMTWKTEQMPKWSYHKLWQSMNPDYKFSLWTDAKIVTFLSTHHPRFTPLLSKLSNIEKADLIRYAVLYTYGGVYADLDAKLLKKIDDWAKVYPLPNTTTALIGIEAFLKDDRERALVSFARIHQYCQWTMMCAPRHPLMLGVLNLIHSTVSGKIVSHFGSRWRVLDTTGPGVFSDGVEAFLNSTDRESYPTIVVPQIAFAVGGYPMNNLLPTEKSLVKHGFRSSWK